jgi:hypothetical protein
VHFELPAAVYVLCFATSLVCAIMLGRSYRRSRASLLFWSSVCFVLLAINNLVMVFDMLVIASVDLQLPRLVVSLAAVGTLLFGFIWNGED